MTTRSVPARDERLDLASRALDRAHALAEEWQGDQSPISRAEAAVLLSEVIELHGWTVTDAPEERPELRLVPAPKETVR